MKPVYSPAGKSIVPYILIGGYVSYTVSTQEVRPHNKFRNGMERSARVEQSQYGVYGNMAHAYANICHRLSLIHWKNGTDNPLPPRPTRA